MHFTTFLTTIVAAGMASATSYNAVAVSSNKNINNSALQASKGNFALKLKNQGATCDRGLTENQVTFSLNKDGELNLFTFQNSQVAYVDRSGMGQGKLGYTTIADKGLVIPKNAETKGWKIAANGDLTFAGKGLIACPYDDSYSLWVDAGVKNPAGNSNCQAVTIRAKKDDKPVACVYSI
ncbi:cell wall protein [Fusarium langsethiae]|uniref:Cell wall protein n=1 Tax=Fusarium langsethiae TaxID=179993 RepID=A0A0M9ENT6_FUSLA|nr:cell wall protein [Fusarium langsethiae]GKU11105.1 unnamed protein product [Fusarium langsethiae]